MTDSKLPLLRLANGELAHSCGCGKPCAKGEKLVLIEFEKEIDGHRLGVAHADCLERHPVQVKRPWEEQR